MRGFPLVLSLVCPLVTATAAGGTPGGAAPGFPVITALLYDDIGVPPAVLGQATQMVTSVYSGAGVTVAWSECLSLRTGRRMAEGCKHRLLANEVVIRVTRRATAPVWRVNDSALGVAVVLEGDGGYYASVYYERIRELSEAHRVGPGTVLGYAMAHEIGHLLLRSPAHSPAGLMRSRWDGDSRRRTEQGLLRLLADEVRRVREEARKRAAAAAAPAD